MPATADQLWDAIYSLGTTDDPVTDLSPEVIAKLIALKMAELSDTGLPQLTEYGDKCFLILESGDGEMTEIDDLAALEDQQRQQQQ